MNPTIAKLLNVLHAHDQVARVLPNGDFEVDAVYCKDGVAYVEKEIVKPTKQAVFEFLNY